ncbi:MAG: twin arginine-targeting protein translocase TatC [Chloroflexi bacterium RBG_16_52_11]|nr:MAG: twin arginine-targeting protein translocase TatC [Chloroflexi bacterium RBG_16_52_11]
MRKLFSGLWRILTYPFRLLARIFSPITRWFKRIVNEVRYLLSEEPEDEPLPDTFVKTMQNPTGLFEHINALRKHLLRAVAALAVTTAFSIFYAQQIIDLLAEPVGGIEGLVAIDVTEPISVFMRVALLSGFVLALPYIAFELWLFAAPGLSRKSRLMGLLAIPAVVLFFLSGVLFTYFVILPEAIPILLNFLGIETIPRPSTYIGFVTSLLFWIGLAFEFPLIIYILASMRIIEAKSLAKQWRLAIVIIAIVAAAITPTIDPITMSLTMIPLTILFFVSVALAFFAQRKREPETE